MLSYFALLSASIFEILWVALLATPSSTRSIPYLILMALCMALSLYFLALASRELPVAVTYAVWVGLGIVGQAIIQHIVFGHRLSLQSYALLFTLIISILGLLLNQVQTGEKL